MALEDPKPASEPEVEKPEQAPDVEANGFYHPDANAPQVQADLPPPDTTIAWSIAESVHHEKPMTWYVGLVVAASVVIVVAFLLTRDVISVVVLSLIAVIFGYGASRTPQALDYKMDAQGVSIGRRHYLFAQYKSFSTVEDGHMQAIILNPLKRYLPPLSLYCPPEKLDEILSVVSYTLPYEQYQPDAADRLTSRIRF